MKLKMKLYLILPTLICLMILCGIIGFMSVKPLYASAASIASVQTLMETEHTKHDVFDSNMDDIHINPYSESKTVKTGIQFYCSENTGTTTSTAAIILNSNSINIDFTNAQSLYRPATAHLYLETGYTFSIKNSSGATVWFASMAGRIEYDMYTGEEVYHKQININGSIKNSQSQDFGSLHFLPSEFGNQRVYLDYGNYTIAISRTYEWTDMDFYCGNSMMFSTSNLSGMLVIVSDKITMSMKSVTTDIEIENGDYVNDRVTVSASSGSFHKLYYKTPTSSVYSSTTSKTYTTSTTNGWYYFYAENAFGTASETLSFYYDSVAPTGTIRSNGSVVMSGGCVGKSFSYSATDNGSGISKLYCKTPVSGIYAEYSSGTVFPANSDEGWYYFYAVDRSGNQSATASVYLENTAPHIEIFRNDKLAFSKDLSISENFDTDIYLNPNDRIKVTCDTSSGRATCNYTLNTNTTIGSAYTDRHYTITVTSATGIVGNFTYHIVRSKPIIMIGGNGYTSGSTLYFNSDQAVSFMDDTIIDDSKDTGATVQWNGNSEFFSYASGNGKTLTTVNGTETRYNLTLNDRAGNESTFTVYIDKLAPTGNWKSDGTNLPNGGYTNKSLSFHFTETGTTATYSHNGGEYNTYASGRTLTVDGTYTVILTDRANNKSTFTAHIDTIPPTGQMYANYAPIGSGTITNGKVYFTWDGNLTATVNGSSYTKNTVLSEDGTYTFRLTDSAQNTATYSVTIDTIAPTYNADKLQSQPKMITRWYVVKFDGKNYSFADYNEALAFACDKEFKANVTVLSLDRLEDFNQHHLVVGGDEVRTGTYWLYKSQANPGSRLYYFNRERLNGVIAYYAKNNVSTVNYFTLDGDNVYGNPADSMSDNVFTAPDGASAPVLNGFVFERTDGSEMFAELMGTSGTRIKIEYGIAFDAQVTVGGLYKFTELDEAGNATVFYGFLDLIAPELKVTATIYGNGSETEFCITKDGLTGIAAYYYESFDVKAILDADKWSVLSVKNNGKTNYYTYGDELPCLTVGGEYLLSVYDRLGNGYSFTVFIVGNPATITVKNNADDTAFDLAITLEQRFDTLVFLEVRRNGVLLDGISASVLNYTFDRAGTYVLTLRDNFGRTITKEYVFVKALPEGELIGVENGGKTKSDVTFTFDNEKYYAVVTKDGQAYTTDYSGELFFNATDENSGIYDIRLFRLTDNENYSDYGFIVNTLAPNFDLTVADGSTTNKNVTVSWSESDIESVVYSLNGSESVTLENGAILSAEGVYIVTATNDLGTQFAKTFTIDKTLDYYVVMGNQPVQNVEVTSDTVAVFNNEDLSVMLTKNGEPFDYLFGDVLSDEGYYTFRINDEFGNTTTFSITIDKSVSYSANVGDGLISNGNVQVTKGEKLTATVTKDNLVLDYEFGQSLDDEGYYKFVLRDVYGNEKSFEFRIVKGIKTTLDYTLGENVSVLKIDRNGEEVLHDGNRLNFTVSGVYIVTAETDGTTYSFVLELDNTAPTLDLIGVKDGGVSGKSVTLDNLSEQATVDIFKDGELIEYELGSELKEYGEYRVVVTDEAGNTNEYNFTLKYKMDGGIIALIVICVLAAAGGSVFLFIKKCRRH